MGLFDGIEKLITEHGSAAIIGQQLAFAKEQFSHLEKKVEELQTETGKLQAQLQREQDDHEKAKKELCRLQKEYEEDIRIQNGIEFRRGKRTGSIWLPFCPCCHVPHGWLIRK
jgi:predicted RNase H-like nuclease (RuvC/YqgF family)